MSTLTDMFMQQFYMGADYCDLPFQFSPIQIEKQPAL